MKFELRMGAEYEGEAPSDRARELIGALGSGLQMRMSMVYDQRLREIAADGNRTFEFRWREYDFGGEVNGEPVPEPPGHDAMVERLLARSARVRTTELGQPVAVEYEDPEVERLGGAFGRMPGALPVYLPERPVGAGDRWEGRIELPLEMPGGPRSVPFRLEHTLREVRPGPDGPVAVIEVRGSYSSLEQAAGGDDAAAAMHFEATIAGSAEFDIDAGWFRDGRYEIDMYAVEGLDEGSIHLTGHATGALAGLGRE